MKLTRYVNSILAPILFLFLIPSDLIGQENNLAIDGTVKDENKGGRMTGATVLLYENGVLKNRVSTEKSGKFEFNLEFDKEYTVEITRSGYVSKRLSFNTNNVPVEEQEYGFEFGGFQVALFQEIPGLDVSILDQPIGKIAYDQKARQFTFDRDYTRSIQERLAQLQLDIEDAAAELEDNYITAIEDGDRFLKEGDYFNARIQFESAAKYKPGEKYPKDALAKIDRLENGEKEINEKYDALIAKAEGEMEKEAYPEAKTAFQEASALKPKESYPKDKIKELDKLIAEAEKEKAAQEKYDNLLAKAKLEMDQRKYPEAKTTYQEAAKLKPSETLPGEKIAEIDKLMAEQEALADQIALDEKYNGFMTKAEQAFNAKNWDDARKEYNNALGVKPDEQKPKDQLAKIDQLEADEKALANQKELDEKYQKFIDAADRAFDSKDWGTARTNYNDALGVKPDEQKPKDQLAKIDQLEADEKALADQKELDEKYQKFIDAADRAFDGKDWDAARTNYNDALGVKPNEQRPKDQLAKIDQLEAEEKDLAEQQATDKKYNDLITKADKAFDSKSWGEARSSYQAAQEVKPSERYPTERLGEIDRLEKEERELADQKALDDKYNGFMTSAEKAFKDKDWETARNGYNDALGVKPNEQKPKDRLKEIDAAIEQEKADQLANEQKAKEKEYQDFVDAGDKAMSAENFTEAKAKYNAALGVMEKDYPRDQIAKIDELVAQREKDLQDQQARDKRFNDLVAEADGLFDSKDYEASKNKYQDALEVKAGEKHPQNRIDEISRILDKQAQDAAAQKELDEKYQGLITQADQSFDNSDFEGAKDLYSKASDVKPEESYPKDRIAEINKKLGELAQAKADQEAAAAKDAEYAKMIDKADKAYDAKEYTAAKKSYQSALNIKPEEKHPQDRIAAIDALLDQQAKDAEKALAEKQKNEKYDGLMAAADKAFGNKEYQVARDQYSGASDVKPEEQKPKDQIAEIDKLLADLADQQEKERLAQQQEEQYKALIKTADAAYREENYEQAKAKYAEALAVKENESYPQRKIDEIDGILADLKAKKDAEAALEAEKREKEEKYQSLIKEADDLLGAKKLKEAKTKYQESLNYKVGADYPSNQIVKINKMIEDARLAAERKRVEDEKRKAQEEKYNKLITQADKDFTAKNYSGAKRNYLEALKVKPDEEHPTQRLDEIKELMANLGKPDTPKDDEKEAPDEFMSELAKKYPQGITEEIIEEDNKKIIRRIVVEGNSGNEYKKVVHNWGGKYFFKNGKSISEYVFNMETTPK